MEIPVEFVCKTENKNFYDQMKEKTLVEVEKFEERRKIGLKFKNHFFKSVYNP